MMTVTFYDTPAKRVAVALLMLLVNMQKNVRYAVQEGYGEVDGAGVVSLRFGDHAYVMLREEAREVAEVIAGFPAELEGLHALGKVIASSVAKITDRREDG